MDAVFDEPARRTDDGQQQQLSTGIGGESSDVAFADPHHPGPTSGAWPADDGRRTHDVVDAEIDRSYLPHMTAGGFASFAAPVFGDDEAYAPTFGYEYQPDRSPRMLYAQISASSTWPAPEPFETGWAGFHSSADVGQGAGSTGSLSDDNESDDDDDDDDDDASPVQAHAPSDLFITTAATCIPPLGRPYLPNAAIAPPSCNDEPLLANSGARRETAPVAPPAAVYQPASLKAPTRSPQAERQLLNGQKPTLKLSRADKVAIIYECVGRPTSRSGLAARMELTPSRPVSPAPRIFLLPSQARRQAEPHSTGDGDKMVVRPDYSLPASPRRRAHGSQTQTRPMALF